MMRKQWRDYDYRDTPLKGPLLNEEMDKILSKVITYDPDKRYQTCLDFKKIWKGILKKISAE